MPTCPRCAALALILLVLAFTGCDSNNPGRDLGLLSDVYQLDELEFVPLSSLPPADIAAQLDLTDTELEIFDDGEAQLRVRYRSEPTRRRRIDLRTTASRGRATFEAADVDDTGNLEALLLPRSFTLTYDGDAPRVLSGSIEQSNVDLEPFDPVRYRGENDKQGTLTIEFSRR